MNPIDEVNMLMAIRNGSLTLQGTSVCSLHAFSNWLVDKILDLQAENVELEERIKKLEFK